MQQRRLGNTGLTVTEVGFGGIPLTRLGLEEGAELVRQAVGLGFRYFDTANLYGDSEVKMGLGLMGLREQVALATKTRARDGDTAARHLEKSLQDLRTDWIDLYQLHNLSEAGGLERVLAPDGAWPMLERAREQGMIRALGFSSHNPDQARAAINSGLFASVQFAFNFVEHDSYQRVFSAGLARGMGLIAMKPLGGGLLQRADLCFRFLQAHPEVVPIPGIQSLAEAQEIRDLYENRRPLSQQDQQDMRAIRAELGERFCHRCEYCLPCEQGVAIPNVMLFQTQQRRFSPEMIKNISSRAMATVENCIECGQCAERCPYDLPIPQMMRELYQQYEQFLAQHGLS
ncbi:MAG: aldo/keto reductase [Desulfarculus sp.]|nr:MAG: aldo/keto reductase [Desulfarculus sp.]